MTDQDKLNEWWNQKPQPGGLGKDKDSYFLVDVGQKILGVGQYSRPRQESSGSGNESNITNLDELIDKKKLNQIPSEDIIDIEELTRGGFGIVYTAKWSSQNKVVILKGLIAKDEASWKKFSKEWEYHESCLSSYGILNLLGFTRHKDSNEYLAVLEYANKGTLRNNLGDIFKSTWKQKLYILYKISAGLSHIHGNGLIHRDFHDSNILFNINGQSSEFKIDEKDDVWISDLGLCHSINSTLDHGRYGVAAFMAPEVIRYQEYNETSDMFSFAMIMWEFTSGVPPFNDRDIPYQIQLDICKGERPAIVKNTPECYETLMRRCWDEDPKKRPSSYEVLVTIVNWIYSLPESAHTNDDYKKEIMEFMEANKLEYVINDAANESDLQKFSKSSVIYPDKPSKKYSDCLDCEI